MPCIRPCFAFYFFSVIQCNRKMLLPLSDMVDTEFPYMGWWHSGALYRWIGVVIGVIQNFLMRNVQRERMEKRMV